MHHYDHPQYDEFDPFPPVQSDYDFSRIMKDTEDEYKEFEKDFSKWSDDLFKQFESEFRTRYPELGGDLVFD